MQTRQILLGSAEEIINHINTTYIEPRNKVYMPKKDMYDIKKQLKEISANNKSKMGIVFFIALKQPPVDDGDIHISLESLYVRIVDNVV
jgi:hypothetical protein